MDFPVFDSRDIRCKQPYGAVPCGTTVTLTLYPSAEEQFTACTLVITGEFAGTREEIPFALSTSEEGAPLFSGSFTAGGKPELMWYCFSFTRADGSTVWLGKNGYCKDDEAAAW